MMKSWNKPILVSFNPSVVKSGGTGSAIYEAYINQGSYGTQTGNAGGPWPCAQTANGCWTTGSFYFTTLGQGASTTAACDQAGFGAGGIQGAAACS